MFFLFFCSLIFFFFPLLSSHHTKTDHVDNRIKCRGILVRMAQRQMRDTSRQRKTLSWRRWTEHVEISKLQDAGMVLQDAIEQRDREKENYKTVVFRRFLTRMKGHVLYVSLRTWSWNTEQLAKTQRRTKHAVAHWRRASVARALRSWCVL